MNEKCLSKWRMGTSFFAFIYVNFKEMWQKI